MAPHAVPSELLTGDVRASAWARATDFYAGYERYRRQLRTTRDQALSAPARRRLRKVPAFGDPRSSWLVQPTVECQIVDRTRATGSAGYMRVVQVANFYGPRSGGLRTAVDRLGAEYCAAGHEVFLIVPGRARRAHPAVHRRRANHRARQADSVHRRLSRGAARAGASRCWKRCDRTPWRSPTGSR